MIEAIHGPSDGRAPELVHPTSGPHTSRARTRLHGDPEPSPENPGVSLSWLFVWAGSHQDKERFVTAIVWGATR